MDGQLNSVLVNVRHGAVAECRVSEGTSRLAAIIAMDCIMAGRANKADVRVGICDAPKPPFVHSRTRRPPRADSGTAVAADPNPRGRAKPD